MDDIGVITRPRPVSSRVEVIERLRALEAEFRALGATALNLYGSAARDALTAESDVDLYIDYRQDGSVDFFKLCRMEDLAVEVLRRDVDFGTRAGLHPVGRIKRNTSGVDHKAFETNIEMQWIVERGLLIISEAIRHVPDDLLDPHPQIPWRQIKAIGNPDTA